MKLNSHNEWDRLREIVVGTAAPATASLIFQDRAPESKEQREEIMALARAAYPQSLIDEVNEDLEAYCDAIRDFGAKVLRPKDYGVSTIYSTPHWDAAGNNLYNMRDLHLVVGNTLIESPSPTRHRYFEPMGLYDIWYDYFENGFSWIVGPKPRLDGEVRTFFEEDGSRFSRLLEKEILFDAANTLRMGRDLIYLVSSSGNQMGAKWLQSVLGSEYRVHTTETIYRSSHIDSTLMCLRPGVVLVCGDRVNPSNCPSLFDKWDKIYFDDIAPTPDWEIDFHDNVRKEIHGKLQKLGVWSEIASVASPWIGMNILSLDPETVIVDKRQESLIKVLEQKKYKVIPVSMRHSNIMKGGLHCSTLDTVRDSTLESYFD